jgi:hypothetical protein
MPTASQVARQRALDKIGKDLAWFDDQVETSLNEHGEPTCAECKQPEKKKLSSGQLKMLTIDTKNVRLICDSCANRAYKKQQKDNVSRRSDRDGAESAETWWKRNRSKLSEAELVQHDIREGDVAFLTQALEEHLKGEGWDAEGLPETIKDFCDEVSQYGRLSTAYTLVPEWWRDEGRSKRLSGPDALYFQFGFYAAIPTDAVSRFLTFAEDFLHIKTCGPYESDRKRIVRILDGKEYIDPDLILACSTKGCANTQVMDPGKIYPAHFFCPTCTAARNRIAYAALSRLNQEKLAETRDATKDSWGRDKLYGDGGPYQ